MKPTTLQIKAPGKLMIAGEYAILENSPAIVSAIDAYASCTLELELPADLSTLTPDAYQACLLAQHRLGKIQGRVDINIQALRKEEKKVGLGSSAASAALAAGVVHAYHQQNFEDPNIQTQIFEDAFHGHKKVSPQGSGADIAASVFGGILKVRKEKESDILAYQPLILPENFFPVIVWTKQEARTSDFLKKIFAFKKQNLSTYQTAIKNIQNAAEQMIAGFESNDTNKIIKSTAEHHLAMKELGEVAGLPIVEKHLSSISGMASQCSGAAKPSGAGGGDVAIAFFTKEENKQEFSRLCEKNNYAIVPFKLGAKGICKILPNRKS